MDKISIERRSANMKAIRSTNTAPEILVRRLVYGMGYRYRLHKRDLPGNPDLVFMGRRKVIFVHGCFWHDHSCSYARKPKSNLDYWIPKLQRTRQRDKEHISRLIAGGWEVLVIWECELRSPESVSVRIKRFLDTPANPNN